MALTPRDQVHGMQIKAGTAGRKRGHAFERELTAAINTADLSSVPQRPLSHLETGNPALLLLGYLAQNLDMTILTAKAHWLGGLATARDGDVLFDEEGNRITKCKSDILVDLQTEAGVKRIGVSVKTCNKKTPTNDQMFFTTAKAFCQLLIQHEIPCSAPAIHAMSMFCGDAGCRPMDHMTSSQLRERASDPNRYYWEELPQDAQDEWEHIFATYQDHITLLLFQKAYKDDPYPPDILLHQTVRYDSFDHCQVALFTMPEIVSFSQGYASYHLSPYKIRKGTYKNDPATHYAPRFGLIQFQRGGQKQHPTQLQFNLKAGYFNHL